jgi:DNA-binding transcriptional MerR regulator
MIRHALALGFSLNELARILRARDKGGVPCREVRAMAEAKLKDLDRRIDEMLGLRDHLRTLLAEWDDRLQRTPEGQRARLLDTLASGPAKER